MKYSRLPLISFACSVALGLAAGSAAAVDASAGTPAGTSRSMPSTVKIATLNTAAIRTTAQAVSDIQRLAATGADVISLQEMGSPARRTQVLDTLVNCSMCPYEIYLPDSAVPGSTPILFRWEKFRLVSTGTRQVSEATYVGPKGAGPSTLRAKFINYVELRERVTGRTVYVLNNHAVPTVQGKGGGPNRRQPKRLALYRQHMDGLKALVTELKATGATVFITGDFNVNYRRDRVLKDPLFPYANMRQVGVRASYESLGETPIGTHVLPGGNDSRLIDYVWNLGHPAVQPVSQQVLRGYASDHRPVLVEFRLAAAS